MVRNLLDKAKCLLGIHFKVTSVYYDMRNQYKGSRITLCLRCGKVFKE